MQESTCAEQWIVGLGTIAAADRAEHRGGQMGEPWKIEKHTGKTIELERNGEIFEITLPKGALAKDIFLRLKVGGVVGDGLIRLLSGRK